MNNGTCCALKSHAKSQYNRKITRDKAAYCLRRPCNRSYVRYIDRSWRRFPVLPSMITARISTVRHYAARAR